VRQGLRLAEVSTRLRFDLFTAVYTFHSLDSLSYPYTMDTATVDREVALLQVTIAKM
jgi:hypothetical protein